ncbi:MAG: rod shape-determining protein RodA [Candidatus Pacebacteria bacterium]|nr:rod shape-determining protein RodA [Candidatus Paceibacterota bacterium]
MWKKDSTLVVVIAIIVSLGLLVLSSLSVQEDPPFSSLKRQIIFLLGALLCCLFFSNLDWRIFTNSFVLVLYYLSCLSLVLVLFIGTRTKGAAGWFSFGPFHLQPVEFTKIILILLLARYLADHHKELKQLRHLFVTGCYTLVPAVLLMAQPDLGGALVILAIWLVLVLISGIRFQQIILLGTIFILVAIVVWFFFLKPYQQARIINFLNPQHDPLGIGYNRKQALIAIGSGQLLGKGLGWGTQTHLLFLPLAKTDFIFAALAEELGFLGVIILLGSFGILCYRLLFWAESFNSNFPKLFTIGFTIKLLLEVFINIGMNIGLLPIVGIALPFLSLGGSHLLADFWGLGIVFSMIKYKN